MDEAKAITIALDQLVAALRGEQEFRLAAVLHHHLHCAAWNNRSELFIELSRVLRHAQASQVSSYSFATSSRIDEILAAMEDLM